MPCGRGTKSRDRCPDFQNRSRDFSPPGTCSVMCNKQPVTWTVCLRFCVCSLLCASGVCNSEKSPCCRGHWEGRTRYNMVSSFAKCVFRRVLVSLVYVGTSLQTCSLNCQCKSTLHNRIGTVPISSCQRAAKRENGLAACQKAKKKTR